MHDLHVADMIHRLVIEYAEKNRLSKVSQIDIELGSVIEHGAAINADNLKFNITMLGQKTLAEGAVVNITEVDGNDWRLVSIQGE